MEGLERHCQKGGNRSVKKEVEEKGAEEPDMV
jgi:hypothetical protein